MNVGQMHADRLIRDTEAAPMLGVSVGRLRNDRSAGVGLPFVRIGSSVRYSLAAIQRYVDEHTVTPLGA